MKKSILSLSLMCCIAFVDAQSYIPFPTKKAHWIESEEITDPMDGYYRKCTEWEYIINSDTVFNGLKYHRIYTIAKYYTNHRYGCVPWNYIIKRGYGSYIRNDSINKKVYLRLSVNSKDTLLYDFDLQLNQRYPPTLLRDTSMSPPGDDYVIGIDSVFLNSQWHKRFKLSIDSVCFSLPQHFYYLIEGIGSTLGLFNEFHCVYNYGDLVCMSIGNRTLYPNNSSGSCHLITDLAHNQINEEKITLSPNPTNGIVYLKGNIALQKIDIYNLQGQKVKTINPQKNEFELPEQTGLYLIRLQDSNGRHYSRKVIKK